MAEIDTSSYPKPAAPVNLLDNVQKLGGLQQQKQQLESGGLVIEKQKLDLLNQRFGEMSKGFAALAADPQVNEDKIRKYVIDQVKLGYITAEMASTTLSQLPPKADAKTLQQHLLTQLQHAQTVVDALNTHAGQNQDTSDGVTNYQGVRQAPIKGGAYQPVTETPVQLPPGTPAIDSQNRPTVIGPKAGPAGPRPYQSPFDIVNDPSQGNLTGPRPSLKTMAAPPVADPSKPPVEAVQPNPAIGGRIPLVTGAAPGVVTAQAKVAEASSDEMTRGMRTAANIQTELQPDLAVLDIVKGKAPGDFGPGTDSLNQLKKMAVTWLPNVDAKLIEDSKDFDTVKKYLVQGARAGGNTGTNDQLAAAFEGSPNVTMNTATIESIVKSRVALKKMEAAQYLLASKDGITPDKFADWKAKNQNVLDPRAFGYDLMSNEARQKLLDSLSTLDKNGNRVAKKGKEKEFNKFERSVEFAHDANLIEPPARR